MTVLNQSFRIMPGIAINACKKNGTLNKAIFFFIKPHIVNSNLQKDTKVVKEIISFDCDAITNSKTPCVYSAEHNQLKKRLNFLKISAFFKAYKLKERFKNAGLVKAIFISFILILLFARALVYGNTLLCIFLKKTVFNLVEKASTYIGFLMPVKSVL